MKCLVSSTKACLVLCASGNILLSWLVNIVAVWKLNIRWVGCTVMFENHVKNMCLGWHFCNISWHFENDRWVGLGFSFIQNRWLWIWQCFIALAFVQIAALHKWNVQWVALQILSEWTWIWEAFYWVGCCTYRGSLEIKCLVISTKRLMHYHVKKNYVSPSLR